ncbi:MAG: GNAT family N-acetyltransferase [Crocinitomicaceae bacterium]
MIRKLNQNDIQNLEMIEVLAFNINHNYTETEKEFWGGKVERTSVSDLSKKIQSNQILAYFDKDKIVGSVVYEIRTNQAKFGMLSVNLDYHGKRIGSQLCKAMESDLVKRGVQKLSLELLVPRFYESANKKRILEWYKRIGFQVEKRIQTEEIPHFPSEKLLVKSDFIVMSKNL